MAAPVRVAAIDAGSNAIRLMIAHAESPTDIRMLESERWPVRLGHGAFTEHRFNKSTIVRAAEAFRHFKKMMERYGAKRWRAVATSAAREARNRGELIRRIRRETGIALEVIPAAEEARLVRSAILGAVGDTLSPRVIADLGGGSLEISVLRGKNAARSFALPLGTVRLMETLEIYGAISEEQMEQVQHEVFTILGSVWPRRMRLEGEMAVASGGNAEALARLLPGPEIAGIRTINLRLLEDRLWPILRLGIDERMETFRIRHDRAEVIGIAAIVFASLGQWLRLRSLLVPGVGVREGVLRDLAKAHFAVARTSSQFTQQQMLLREMRHFAARFRYEPRHAEQVRALAVSLFDQLAPVHGLPFELRFTLELAAIAHDVGYAINSSAHRKHGEYVIRHADIPGLPEAERMLLAAVVRYHGTSDPAPQHKLYSSLGAREKTQVRALAAIFRLAVAMDEDHKQAVRRVDAIIRRKEIRFRVSMSDGSRMRAAQLMESAELFEKLFGRKVRFEKARGAGETMRGALAGSHRAA